MSIFSYIIPQEWVLRIIILAMIGLACFVIYKCWTLYTLGKENLAMLEQMENVDFLKKALLQNDIDLDQEFSKYEESLGKNDRNFVLFEHLKAIYDAGAQSSRLDADLLVKNTVDKIFTGVDSLKTSISLFLVIGILGTLVGLAISIGGFSGGNFVMSGQNGATADELSLLFNNLRGAFAPSMWGVFFTIVFVFSYSWKIQEGCINKVAEKLTINTIRYWLPNLYPTDFQKGEQSLVKLKATIANADGINSGVRALEKNLTSSNATLQQLSKVSDSIQQASHKFDQSTDKITKLKVLYDELKQANENFNSSVTKLVDSALQEQKTSYQDYMKVVEKNCADVQNANQDMKEQMIQYFDALTEVLKQQNNSFSTGLQQQIDTWKMTLEQQNSQLKQVISQLQVYDENFFQTVNESKDSLNKSIEVNRKAAMDNQALAEKLREFEDKLLHRQDELMAQISQPMTQKLSNIAEALQHIQNPLNEATKKISDMADNNCRILKETIDPLTVTVEALKDQKGQLNEQDDQLKQLLLSLQKTAQSFHDESKAMMVMMASKQGGASSEIINQYLKAQADSMADTVNQGREREMAKERELELLLSRERGKNAQNGFLSVKNIPAFIIAVLLFVSVITQVVMVNKISTLERNQAAVNQVLMKGEMNDTSSDSGQ